MKKRIIILIFVFALLAFSACAKGGTYDEGNGFNNVADSPITTENLNDIRSVVGKNWGYALVAGSSIFNEDGYYKFKDVLEYNFAQAGIALGADDQREVFFARGEDGVYGVYRARISGGKGYYYLFNSDYKANLSYSYMGAYDSGEVSVGTGGDMTAKMLLLGDKLFVVDYTQKNIVKSKSFDGAIDFSYFQKGSTAVSFAGGKTQLTTYIAQESTFKTVEVDRDLSLSDSPELIGEYYIFGGDAPVVVNINDGQTAGSDADAAMEEYQNIMQAKEQGLVYEGNISAKVSGGNAVITVNGSASTVTQSEICAVKEIAAAIDLRASQGQNLSPQITSVKISGGEVFIIVEKQPEGLIGIRDINDGIPQMVVKYDPEDGALTFVGMVDFTGYNVYRIVKIS